MDVTVASSTTRLYRAIEVHLDQPLAQYVAENKSTKSWREMANDLTQRTGVEVSYEALRKWFAHRITVKTVVSG